MAKGGNSAKRFSTAYAYSDAFLANHHDVNPLTHGPCRALWVGGLGNLNVVMADGTTVLFTAVPAGTLMPIAVSQVMASLTTATLVIALYGP